MTGTQQIQPELIPANDSNWKKGDALAPAEPSWMGLMDYAVKNQSAIEVIKELRAMQTFDAEKRSEREFNDAMKAAQEEVSVIIPDATNEQTGKKYATYKALNAVLRPVYLKHGFDLTFNAAPSPVPEEIYVLCECSHKGGCTKPFMVPMSTDNKGPKGGGVMSKQQAYAGATSYGRSVILKLMFNIAIGEDDGIKSGPEMPGLDDWCTAIREAHNFEDMDKAFRDAYSKASGLKSESAKAAIADARNEWRKRKGGTR